jgi:molybdopterin-guanine dinucleotide biosynthesis protein A
MDNIYGVILCGGDSRRMGRDKGLLDTGEGYWASRMANKLAPLPVFYSINPQQWENYSRVLPLDHLIPDSPRLPGVRGPLKGLLSVYERFPDKDLLLVACDLQDLDSAAIDDVTEAYNRQQEWYDFFVYQDEGFFQPFCGIYTARGLAAIYQQAGEGRLVDNSLQRLLKEARTNSLPILNPAAFRNYNSI